MYQVTAKLAHGLYHSATVVDYNLILKFLIIGDVKYLACIRLQKIETQSTMVIQNKYEQALHTCSVVLPCYLLIRASADRKHTIFGCDN